MAESSELVVVEFEDLRCAHTGRRQTQEGRGGVHRNVLVHKKSSCKLTSVSSDSHVPAKKTRGRNASLLPPHLSVSWRTRGQWRWWRRFHTSTTVVQAFSDHDGVHHLQVRQWWTAAADEKGPKLTLVDAILSHDLATRKVSGDLIEYAPTSEKKRYAD